MIPKIVLWEPGKVKENCGFWAGFNLCMNLGASAVNADFF